MAVTIRVRSMIAGGLVIGLVLLVALAGWAWPEVWRASYRIAAIMLGTALWRKNGAVTIGHKESQVQKARVIK